MVAGTKIRASSGDGSKLADQESFGAPFYGTTNGPFLYDSCVIPVPWFPIFHPYENDLLGVAAGRAPGRLDELLQKTTMRLTMLGETLRDGLRHV